MVKNVKTTNVQLKKKCNCPHNSKVPDWAPLTCDPSWVTLVRLFPLLTARARIRGTTAAFVGRDALPSIQAGLGAHSYTQEKQRKRSLQSFVKL